MKKGEKEKNSDQKSSEKDDVKKTNLTLDDTITHHSDESKPRRYRNPISQRWDDTTWL